MSLLRFLVLFGLLAYTSAAVHNRANLHRIFGTLDDGCSGRCGDKLDPSKDCQCNYQCVEYNDCCSDYDAICNGAEPESCAGKCNTGMDPDAPCQCNQSCTDFGDCCPDYNAECGGGTDPDPVTNAELAALAEELLSLDVNNAMHLIKLDLQDSTSSGGPDNCPDPLLAVDPAAYQIPTIAAMMKLQDNYIPAVGSAEVVTDAELAEEQAFLDAIFATSVMQRAEQFITEKQLITGNVREALYQIWFGRYSRSGSTLGSSGFEHSFVGELKSGVSGFHNWVYFSTEEAKGNADYHGYIETVDYGAKGQIVTNSFDWLGQNKPTGGYFVGSSPEFEFALYSVCFYARRNAKCPMTLNGQNMFIQTYDLTFNGQKFVASAYPAKA